MNRNKTHIREILVSTGDLDISSRDILLISIFFSEKKILIMKNENEQISPPTNNIGHLIICTAIANLDANEI